MDRMRGISRSTGRPKIPKVQRRTQFPQPPRAFPNPTQKPVVLSGPGEPPPGFVTGNTSLAEWMCFWALMKELGPPQSQDNAAGVWAYQVDAGDGIARVDFAVFDREPRLAIRVQTPYFHVAVTEEVRLFDHTQRDILHALGWDVIDVFSEHFEDDPSGVAVLEVIRDALAGIERPNPAAFQNTLTRPV